jgi:general secretion pathway protein D
MKLSVEVSSVTGQSPIGGISQPIISQRKIEHEIRLKEGEANVLGGLITRSDTKSVNGWPGLARLPFFRYFFSTDVHNSEDDEILIILTPHIVRMPEWTRANLRPLYTGSESQVQVRHESEVRSPNSIEPRATPPGAGQQAPGAATVPPAPGTAPTVPSALGAATTVPGGANAAQIRFEPRSVSLKVGQTQTIGVVVENVKDLFSIPFLLQFNPAVISVEEVQHGGFLSGGNQEIAIVCSGCGSASQADKPTGQAIISATRQPNTAGVNGTGTIMGIVVKAIAPGASNLSIVQVNAKDSQQKPIALVTGEAAVQVQP